MFWHSQSDTVLYLSFEPFTDLFIFRIVLIDSHEVCNLHNSLFRTLQTISTPGRYNVNNKIDYIINLNFRLAHTYSLD